MLNPEVLKCHEVLLTLETLTSLGAWGGGGGESFNIQTGPSWFTSIPSFILIYMSNIEAIS